MEQKYEICSFFPWQSKARKDDFLKRVHAVAFTDSVHSLGHQGADQQIQKFFQSVSTI